MNHTKKVSVRVGPGFLTMLTIAFIVLKLCGVIAWSWWWVLSPLLIPMGLAAFFVLVAFVFAILGHGD